MHKPIRFCLLLFILQFLPALSLYAQTDFRPGYVVLLSGDTLRGEVDYRGAQRSAYTARFRQQGTTTQYDPAQLRGYGFPGDRAYQSEIIPLADSTKQPTFLQVLVAGPVSLLSYRNKEGADLLYVRDQGGALRALVQTTQQTEANGIRYATKDNAYQRTLAATFTDCLAVQPALAKLPYGSKYIAEVVRQYNRCATNEQLGKESVEDSRRTSVLSAEVMAGGTINQLGFSSDYFAARPLRSGIIPLAGVAAQLHLAALNQHLGLRLEAFYVASASYHSTNEFKSDGYTVYRESRARVGSIRIPLLLRYSWPGKRVQPFLQAGISGNYFLKNVNESRTRYLDRTSFPNFTKWSPIIQEPRKFEQGLVGSIGLQLLPANGHAVSAEVRCERTNGFSEYIKLRTHFTYYSVLVSYSLAKQQPR